MYLNKAIKNTNCVVENIDTSCILSNMKWYDLVKSRMADKKIKQDDLISVFNVKTRGAVGHYLNGRRTPSAKQLMAIAEKFDLTLDQLMNSHALIDVVKGESDKYPNKSLSSTTSEPTYVLGGFDLWDDDTPLRDDEVALPFFREVELSAGSGRHEVIENHGRKLRFSKATLKSKSVDINDAACITVSGNSMEPAMPDGATIGVDISKKDISNGEIYAIAHDGDLRVKIVYRLPGGVIRLRSFNSDDWPDELYSVDDAAKIKIIGRVFWWSVLR